MEDGLKMNKENLQKLIDTIKTDGQKKFNMSVFIGKLTYEEDEYNVFENDELASNYSVSRVGYINTGTAIFNCTSMGCIAGFATAIANDWKAPEWLSNDSHIDHVNSFEQTSNMFLGFSHEEGRNIYFGNGACIWKWLMEHEPDRYPQLKLEEYSTLEYAEEDGLEWDNDDLAIDFKSIDYLTAVDVLTRILNEEIGLACLARDYPYYIKKDAVIS
jgi:hypothetical protein